MATDPKTEARRRVIYVYENEIDPDAWFVATERIPDPAGHRVYRVLADIPRPPRSTDGSDAAKGKET